MIIRAGGVVLCLLLFVAGFATGEDYRNKWELTVKAEKNDLFLGEPLRFQYSIENKGDRTQRLESYRAMHQILLSEDGKEFKKHLDVDVDSFHLAKKAPFPLQPGKSKTFDTIILFSHNHALGGEDSLKSLAFPHPGKFWVKVLYKEYRNPVEQTITIQVQEPQGRDAQAWKICCHESVFRVLQFEEYYAYSEEEEDKKVRAEAEKRIRRVLKDYPDTAYARILREYWEAPAKARAEAAAQDPSMAQAILDRTKQELEAERYDLRGFWEDNPQEGRKFDEFIGEIGDQLALEKISDEEFFRQWAERLKTVIRKHCKPLSPEEWARRQAIYRVEDAKREEEQDREFEKGIESQRKILEAHNWDLNALVDPRNWEKLSPAGEGRLPSPALPAPKPASRFPLRAVGYGVGLALLVLAFLFLPRLLRRLS